MLTIVLFNIEVTFLFGLVYLLTAYQLILDYSVPNFPLTLKKLRFVYNDLFLYIKYSYLMQIICTQLYSFKYSYLMQIICI